MCYFYVVVSLFLLVLSLIFVWRTVQLSWSIYQGSELECSANNIPWQPVDATILAVSEYSSTHCGYKVCSPDHWIQGTYSYEWRGTNYTSSNLEITGRRASIGLYDEYNKKRKTGAVQQVWVNPHKPTQATLDRDFDNGELAGTLFFGILLNFGVVGGAWMCCFCVVAVSVCREDTCSAPEHQLHSPPGAVVNCSALDAPKAPAAARENEVALTIPTAADTSSGPDDVELNIECVTSSGTVELGIVSHAGDSSCPSGVVKNPQRASK